MTADRSLASHGDLGDQRALSRTAERQRPGPSGTDSPPITLRLLGGFQLLAPNGEECRLPKSSSALLAFLMLNRARVHARSVVAGVMWPDVADERARRKLTQELWRLRKALAGPGLDGVVRSAGSTITVSVDHPVWIDAEALRETERQHQDCPAAIQEAVDLYRGDLLSGHYDEWVLEEQRRYRTLYGTLLRRQLDLHRSAGNLHEAMKAAHRLVALEPMDEDAHCHVIRLYGFLGRPHMARLQYEQLSTVLQTELGQAPLPSTTQLYERVVASHGSSYRPLEKGERAPFVGRDALVDEMLELGSATIAGTPTAAVVEGVGGVGKTRLLEEVCARLRWQGATTFWALHDSSTRLLTPYGGIVRALEPILVGFRRELLEQHVDERCWATLARLLASPADRPSTTESARSRALGLADERWTLHEAICQLLFAQARLAPTVLVIDDAHHMGEDSLELLSHLVRSVTDQPLCLVVNVQPDEEPHRPALRDALEELRTRGARTITVTPLPRPAAEALARFELGSNATGITADDVARFAGGNPLFLLETARSASTSQLATGRPHLRSMVGREVLSVVSSRIDHLEPDEAAVVSVLAVAERALTLETLSSALHLSRASAHRAVAGAVERGLLQAAADDTFDFRHELVRTAVYRELRRSDRRAYHRVLGDLFAGRDAAEPAYAARHLTRAGRLADAAELYLRAGNDAVVAAAYRTAAERFKRGLRCARFSGRTLDGLAQALLPYEEVLDVLGARADQRRLLDQLRSVRAQHPSWLAELYARRALLDANTGDMKAAVATAEQSVALAGTDPQLAARALTCLGKVLSWAGRDAEAIEPLERALSEVSAPHELCDAFVAIGAALLHLQEYDDAERALQRAIEIASENGEPRHEVDALSMTAIVAATNGRVQEAEATFEQAITLARAAGYRRGVAVSSLNLGTSLALRNRLSHALQHYDRAAEAFESLGDRRGRAMVLANSSAVRARLTVDPGAERDAQEALRFFVGAADAANQAVCLDTLAAIDLRAGRRQAGRKRLHRALELTERAGNRWVEVQIRKSIAEAELAMGRHNSALEEINRASAIAKELEITLLIPLLQAVEGRVLAELGYLDRAAELADKALELISAASAQPHLAALHVVEVHEMRHDFAAAATASAVAYARLWESIANLDDTDRESALTRVAPNAAVVAAYERHHPVVADVRLAMFGAPSGRPLDDDEMMPVRWTISHPDDSAITDKVERRHQRVIRLISEAVNAGAEATVAQLADALASSVTTLKRDLAHLRNAGYVLHTRGSR